MQQRDRGIDVKNEPTHGIFDDGNTTIKLRSGSNQTSKYYRQNYIEENNVLKPPRELDISLGHVEGNAATIMRELNISEGAVIINHEEGPCYYCRTTVEDILLEGQTLIVYWNDITGKTERIVLNGKASR